MALKEIRRKKKMKNYIGVIASALCFGTFMLLAPTSYAQNQAGLSKLEAISRQLILTPMQEAHSGQRRAKGGSHQE
jgi:hypothetical protein